MHELVKSKTCVLLSEIPATKLTIRLNGSYINEYCL